MKVAVFHLLENEVIYFQIFSAGEKSSGKAELLQKHLIEDIQNIG